MRAARRHRVKGAIEPDSRSGEPDLTAVGSPRDPLEGRERLGRGLPLSAPIDDRDETAVVSLERMVRERDFAPPGETRGWLIQPSVS